MQANTLALHATHARVCFAGFASAQSGTKHRELDLRPSPQPPGSITTATTSTLQLTTIEEVEEISPPPPTPEKTDYSTEVIRNSGAEREGKGEGEGEGEGEREKEVFGEESGSVPSTPITSDSGERVRKRYVCLSHSLSLLSLYSTPLCVNYTLPHFLSPFPIP